MAHIFAAQDDGPRPNQQLTEEERGEFNNLILLCANCHTVIDKAPETFPDSVVLKWKRDHEARIAAAFGSVSYETRTEARKAFLALTVRTGAIHQRVGPNNEYKWNPEADEADEWRYHVRETIIPTNCSVLSLLDRNRDLLMEDELARIIHDGSVISAIDLVLGGFCRFWPRGIVARFPAGFFWFAVGFRDVRGAKRRYAYGTRSR